VDATKMFRPSSGCTTGEQMSCEYCQLTSEEMHALGRPPIARCRRCRHLRYRVTGEHAEHTDYSRFWCDVCNGWQRQGVHSKSNRAGASSTTLRPDAR